ncbi:hypothetical protein K439DRAFT_1029217 [Ramaria rubella]|nr:hypothetical protein K439DRAFT_1029217 [Ramaria rubella]
MGNGYMLTDLESRYDTMEEKLLKAVAIIHAQRWENIDKKLVEPKEHAYHFWQVRLGL